MSTAMMIELEDGEVSDRDGGRPSGNPPGLVASNQFKPPDREQEAISGEPIIPGVGKDIRVEAISDIRIDEGIRHDLSPPSKFITHSFKPADSHHSSPGATNRHSPIADKSKRYEAYTKNELGKPVPQEPTAAPQSKAEVRVKDALPAGIIPGNAPGDGKLPSSFLLSSLIF